MGKKKEMLRGLWHQKAREKDGISIRKSKKDKTTKWELLRAEGAEEPGLRLNKPQSVCMWQQQQKNLNRGWEIQFSSSYP